MLTKVVFTGLIFSTLLLLPGVLKDELLPPEWLQAVIIVLGLSGLLFAFIGSLVSIWVSD